MDTRNANSGTQIVYLAADGNAVTNSTTPADSGLEITLSVGTYLVESSHIVASAVSNNGGIKMQWTTSGGTATTGGMRHTFSSSNNAQSQHYVSANLTQLDSSAANASLYLVNNHGIVVITGSNVTIKLQHSSNITDAALPVKTAKAGSYIRAVKLA